MGATTYGISEARAHLSWILREMDQGDGVIITRRVRPCGRLIALDTGVDDKPSLATLRSAFTELSNADYWDFRNIRTAAGRWRT